MKIKTGFVIRQLAGQWVVVPTGSLVIDFGSMISLNDTGAFLWQALETECTEASLHARLMEVYEIDADVARADLNAFLTRLRENDILEES